MERDRLNVPDARPLYAAAFFAGKALARLPRLPVHAGKHAGIEVALIESSFAAANHRRHNSGKSFQTADGTHGFGILFGNRPDLKR